MANTAEDLLNNNDTSVWKDYVMITVVLELTYGAYEHFIAWVYIKKPSFLLGK